MDVIKSIQAEDYSEGPIVDDLSNFKEMWVFGKDVNGSEVYVNYPKAKDFWASGFAGGCLPK